MRKLTELYSELRQVHRRLESDLRGVRDAPDYEEEGSRQIEMQTRGRGAVTGGNEADENVEKREMGASESRYQAKQSRGHAAPSPSRSNSKPLETLFTLAPNHPRPFVLDRRQSREGGKSRRRRQHSAVGSEQGDGREDGVKYAGTGRGSARR